MAKPPEAPSLGDLRKEIDRIDEAMHQLLIERSEIIDRLIAVKRSQDAGSSAFRPAREADEGVHLKNLYNLYVYFWRWATWKVWESTPDDETGVVCLITTSGYLTGSAFTGMRRYIRKNASAGWIVDLTPEGQTPNVPTRIFPGVRQPLASGIFVRQPGTSMDEPADLRYLALHGRRGDKG